MKTLLVILVAAVSIHSLPLAEYYCGFSSNFCGQSSTDDTNANSSLIILAFANIQANGSVLVDMANYPCALVQQWQSEGKKVFLSIGGATEVWAPLFANPSISIPSILAILGNTTLNGIDFDI
jgi:hypothetical protein